MAEEPRPDPSTLPPDNSGLSSPKEHTDTNWGADWESAFQAEDDSFFAPDDQEFFLEEEASKETTPAADAALEKALAEAGSGGEAAATPHRPALPSISLAPLLGLFGKITALPALLLPLPRAIWQRFTALSVRLQLIIISASLVFLLTGGVTLWFLSASTAKVAPSAKAPPPPVLTEEAQKVLAGVPAMPEKMRKKLTLNGFLIPVRDDKGSGSMLFVQIDLTLNTLIGEEEELAADKEAMARDIIYQFFANRPLADLRRYQLARGDLQRDLRAWLEKQWPDTPIESITFTRYQLG